MQALDLVADAIDELHCCASANLLDTALPDAALCEAVVLLRQQIDRLEAAWSHLVALTHERGAARAAGYASTAAFLHQMCHLSPGVARSRVTTATALHAHPALDEVFTEGAISQPHVTVVTTTLAALPDELATAAEPVLVEAALQYDPKRVAQIARRVRHIADPDGAADRDARHREARWLDVSTTLDGLVALNGLLDAEAGAVLRTWLDAAVPPPVSGDERTAAQRRADALVELARTALDAGRLPDSGGERPHLLVTVDLAALRGRSTAPGELAWAGPIDAEAARRIGCDAAVTRIVVDRSGSRSGGGFTQVTEQLWDALPPALRGPTQILDVGRATRAISAAMRKALVVRDQGCTFPGCDRPPPWCDAHHVAHWANGGVTALSNLVLLCRHHHTVVHDGGWRITVHDDNRIAFSRAGPGAT